MVPRTEIKNENKMVPRILEIKIHPEVIWYNVPVYQSFVFLSCQTKDNYPIWTEDIKFGQERIQAGSEINWGIIEWHLFEYRINSDLINSNL